MYIQFIHKSNPCFKYKEAIGLYASYEKFNISNENLSFNDLLTRNDIYSVLVNGNFEGCLYLHNLQQDTCYLSGFSKRYAPVQFGLKMFLANLKDTGFKTIYSETKHRHASLCLKRAGFKHYKDNIYRKEL